MATLFHDSEIGRKVAELTSQLQDSRLSAVRAYVELVATLSKGADPPTDAKLRGVLDRAGMTLEQFTADLRHAATREHLRRRHAERLANADEAKRVRAELSDLESQYQAALDQVRQNFEPELQAVNARLHALSIDSNHKLLSQELLSGCRCPALDLEKQQIIARRRELISRLSELQGSKWLAQQNSLTWDPNGVYAARIQKTRAEIDDLEAEKKACEEQIADCDKKRFASVL